MPEETPSPTSFSAGRRWGILLSVFLSIAAVIALAGMVNYLGARHFLRFYWSTQTRMILSPQTIGLLKSITNQVRVVVYYDKHAPMYDMVTSMLDQYHLANGRIMIERVDYLRDTGGAQQAKTKYSLTSTEDKDLIVFDCGGRFKQIEGKFLGDYSVDAVPNSKDREFERHLKGFKGEEAFNALLLSVTNPKPLTACFLEGNGEHPSDSTSLDGYQKFQSLLQLNYIDTRIQTNLLGTNAIDCNLLIIAGPQRLLPQIELQKIKDYLAQGGRLFVLFNCVNLKQGTPTGLEPILASWGVDVGNNILSDKENSSTPTGADMVVRAFNPKHPLVNPLLGSRLDLFSPRSIGILPSASQSPDLPKVDELFFTSPTATISGNPMPANRAIPLAVAVEKSSVKGVFTERGLTRIVAVGDSLFLENGAIEGEANRDFASRSVNWLLDQSQLLKGAAAHPVTEYKLVLTRSQLTNIRWLFLAGMPGGILLLGGLVWLRRRH